MSGLYGYWDNVKQKVVYIGQAKDIERRLNAHMLPSHYNKQKINRVLQNNPDRYEQFILCEGDFTTDELNELEYEAVEIFKTNRYKYPENEGFNFRDGGKVKEIPEESKQKMSEAKKGEKHHFYGKKRPEHSKKMKGENNPFYKKTHTKETRKKISEANKGRNKSIEDKIKDSKIKNTTGYFRVSKVKLKTVTQGFLWCYQYYDEDGKKKSIKSVDLKKVEAKVKEKGLTWMKL